MRTFPFTANSHSYLNPSWLTVLVFKVELHYLCQMRVRYWDVDESQVVVPLYIYRSSSTSGILFVLIGASTARSAIHGCMCCMMWWGSTECQKQTIAKRNKSSMSRIWIKLEPKELIESDSICYVKHCATKMRLVLETCCLLQTMVCSG